MSQIFEDFKKYRDKYGMNQLNTDGNEGGVTQNGALFTMEYLLCLLSYVHNEDGTVNPEIFKEAQDEILRLRDVYASLENKPGLSVRSPGSGEFDSMDNDGSILMFSMLFGNREYARRHRDQGLNVQCDGIDEQQDPTRNQKYYLLAKIISTLQLAGFMKAKNYWNNQNPNKFSLFGWYGRSPGHMGWTDICATGHTTWFRAAGVWVGQLLSIFAKPGNTDAWKLPYICWYYLKERGWIWRLGYSIWKRKFLQMYPGGMKEVYSIYYGDPNHPIRKYAKPTL